jgi:hypothetical protein
MLEGRIAAAERGMAESQLVSLRNRLVSVERQARLANLAAQGTFMERAQAVRDRAVELWPDSVVLGASRLAVAAREAEDYAASHGGMPGRVSKRSGTRRMPKHSTPTLREPETGTQPPKDTPTVATPNTRRTK